MPSDLGKTLLIANPAAQRGNGAQAAQIACDLLTEWLGEGRLEFALTERPKHAIDLAAEASRERLDTVIALGGDGIVHEVVNGLMKLPEGDRPRFGLIPVGSGNDYARTLGMSECVPDAVTQFIGAHEQAADVGRCNGEFFAETLSFGLDAAIALDTVQRRQRTGEQGTILYLKSGLDQLLHHLDTYHVCATLQGGDQAGVAGPVCEAAYPPNVPNDATGMPRGAAGSPGDAANIPRGVTGNTRAMNDNHTLREGAPTAKSEASQGTSSQMDCLTKSQAQRTIDAPILMMAVQVGPTYGGGFRICPNASISDGLLDICYATAPMSIPEATIKFLSAKDAHHTKWKNIHFERAASLEVSFDRRPPCQIDGEPHVADSYVIDVLPAALRVLVA